MFSIILWLVFYLLIGFIGHATNIDSINGMNSLLVVFIIGAIILLVVTQRNRKYRLVFSVISIGAISGAVSVFSIVRQHMVGMDIIGSFIMLAPPVLAFFAEKFLTGYYEKLDIKEDARIRDAKDREIAEQRAIEAQQYAEQQRLALLQRAEQERIAAQRAAEQQAARKVYEEQERIRIQSQQLQEEQLADTRMAHSELIHDVAMCLIPYFQQRIEEADRKSHLIVSIEFSVCVNVNGISYFQMNGIQSDHREFIWKKENITEYFSPIMRKSICKALISELQVILFDLYPHDANGQSVNIHLDGEVYLSPASNQIVTDPIPGVTYYDDSSYASAKIVYNTFSEKKPRTF